VLVRGARIANQRMDEDIPDPVPEKPRHLLPDGCKDLIDLLRLEAAQGDVKAMQTFTTTPGSLAIFLSFFPGSTPESNSASVTLPDPVTVKDLAIILHRKPFEVIADLMEYNLFVAINQQIDFGTAATLCAHHYGVTAVRKTS
jgi:hypothetical protein